MLWLLEHLEQLNPAEVLSCLPLCSAARRKRLSAVRNESARVQGILAEVLLRYALLQEYGLTELPELRAGEKGKPFFPELPDLHWNLSHCRTAVACALDASPVGVDVQEYRPLFSRKAPPGAFPSVFRTLSQAEFVWVTSNPDALPQQNADRPTQEARFSRSFIRVWTCKEAYGKALGVGLSYDFRATEFLPRPDPWTQYGFTFTHLDLPEAALTLCGQGSLSLQRIPARDLLSNPFEIY